MSKTLVTILILIDGFLQLKINNYVNRRSKCHNPYFNRWFSAIVSTTTITLSLESHNPYFNRWFSAMINQSFFKQWNVESQSLF